VTELLPRELVTRFAIGAVEKDRIHIDVPNRTIDVVLPEGEIEQRRTAVIAKGDDAYHPHRDRKVSAALRAYAAMSTSAAYGAVRDVCQIEGTRRRG
jgi:dihydroxy-acid dehydratase